MWKNRINRINIGAIFLTYYLTKYKLITHFLLLHIMFLFLLVAGINVSSRTSI